MSLWTPPILFADRIGNFYLRLFLLLRKASNAITRLPKAHNNVNMPMKIERISKAVIHATVFALLQSVLNGCPLDIQHPFLCIPASRSFGVGRLPLRSATVGAKQASTGRLAPCHGYFPIAYTMQLIYHFFRYNSTIFVNLFISPHNKINCKSVIPIL